MLEKKSIEKKKQALNDEKNLISERLNFRKKMINEETKAEELAELKRQLAQLSADTTRTKEANELRRKIQEMERDMAIQTAEDVANAEIKSNDDKIQAWDNYITIAEEDLSNLLSNANNFREQLDTLMNGSFEDFVAWNAQYNESYKNATDEQRKQMEEGWEDTWLNMLGLLRTYWEEVDEVSRSKESWLALVTSQDSFASLSAEQQQIRLRELEDQYDAMVKAQTDNAEFDDTHEILNTIQDMKDWVFNVNIPGLEDYLIGSGYSTYSYNRDRSIGEAPTVNNYEGTGKVYVPEPTYVAPAEESSGSGSGNGSGTSKGHQYAANVVLSTSSGYKMSFTGSSTKSKQDALDNAYANAREYSPAYQYYIDSNAWQVYKKGGLVDYTGPAWVDGTKADPEAFLSSTDTKLLRGMLDSFNYVRVHSYTHNFDDLQNGKPNVSIGDVNVNLNVEKLEDDSDYEEIANKVGKVFTKQLEKQGLALAGYTW